MPAGTVRASKGRQITQPIHARENVPPCVHAEYLSRQSGDQYTATALQRGRAGGVLGPRWQRATELQNTTQKKVRNSGDSFELVIVSRVPSRQRSISSATGAPFPGVPTSGPLMLTRHGTGQPQQNLQTGTAIEIKSTPVRQREDNGDNGLGYTWEYN